MQNKNKGQVLAADRIHVNNLERGFEIKDTTDTDVYFIP
jgi:hypothetical protein